MAAVFWYSRMELVRSFCHFFQIYIRYWNEYYGTNYYLLEPYHYWAESGSGSLLIFMAAAIPFVWFGARETVKKRVVLTPWFAPFIVCVGLMLVGQVPRGPGLPGTFLSAFLYELLRRNEFFPCLLSGRRKSVRPFLCSVLILTLSFLFGTLVTFCIEPAQWTFRAKEMIQTQISELSSLNQTNHSADPTQNTGIGNGDLNHGDELLPDDDEVLIVTLDQEPQVSLFLRGFSGSIYENNAWRSLEISEFPDTLQQNPEKIWYPAAWDKNPEITVSSMEVLSLNEKDSYLYHPYQDIISSSAEYQGDAYLTPGSDYNQLGVYSFPSALLELEGTEFYDYWNEFDVALNPSSYTQLVEEWYCRYPENSLKKVEDWYQEQSFDTDQDPLVIAKETAELLSQQAEYNLTPGSVPQGTDAVEWFLLENHQGYCMHFASAGTLILRMAGVAARYAEGYRIEPSSFQATEDGKWRCTVTQKQAHAWTEVYLDHFGWYPVEMTPSSDQTENMVINNTISESAISSMEETEVSDMEPSSSLDSISETLPEAEKVSENPDDTDEDKTENWKNMRETDWHGSGNNAMEDSRNNQISGNSKTSNPLFPYIAALIVVLLIALTFFGIFYRYGIRHKQKQSSRHLSVPVIQHEPREAVLLLGHEILAACIQRGAPKDIHFSSGTLRQSLKPYLSEEEIQLIMDIKPIINRAQFSCLIIEEEDYQIVLNCCRRILHAGHL
ncbi:MAG: transglutaminase-like domain-containing protein [Clostridiales bacterium]|nr:transglutaminase-like domain-containing protein [Clostridiales bacterium]